MKAKDMRTLIWSFSDQELKNILDLVEPDSSKAKMIRTELRLRKKERKQGKYVDKTMNPKVPIRVRLDKLGEE